ncbi:hypothetical protein GCM10010994_44600 [Chelatococcus reniformis]|uniref:Hedgehog/Intein (Hint) domain-containing protein n=2 Tax=Chelatococcus reniformis TaxID=1494448 RepID=A0A916XLN8_9HYPH|nr:hypothetical protein GCM10010994_44600 [Chelatococcus reniformis]
MAGGPVLSTNAGNLASLTVGSSAAMNVLTGGHLNLSNGLTSTGHIDVQGSMTIGGGFSNTGTIDLAAGSVMQLNGIDLTLADFAGINNAGQIALASVLDLGGGILDLASFGKLSTSSTIVNGTIVDNGVTSQNWGSGTFDGIIYQGDINISGRLTVVNGLTVVRADGQPPGTINMSSVQATLALAGVQTIDAVVINLSSTFVRLLSDEGLTTFGPNAVVNVSDTARFYGSFLNLGQIDVASYLTNNGNMTNDGVITVAAGGRFTDTDFVNNGSVTLQAGGTADLTGPLTGTGTIALEGGASITLGVVDAQQTVALVDGQLTLTNAAGFAATIDDFDDAADVITLANVSFDAGDTVTLLAGNVLQITQAEDGSIISLQLDPAGSYGGLPYQLVDDGAGGTDIVVTCFLAGARIATPKGEPAVETLAAGDIVLTAEGGTRSVLWIGRQTVVAAFADPLRTSPVRIAAGALDEAIPARDLYVSPDHAMLVDCVLVQAGALVNGTTITRVEHPEPRFTYYHIELEDHALVLAEGAPAETFVDNVTRRRFDNYAEYEALFGDCEARLPEMDLPRVKSARQLPRAVRERLTARAEALGVLSAAAA